VGVSERPGSRAVGASIGLIAGGVAVGVAQLIAGVIDPRSSPLVAVGQAAIDLTPEWLKDWAIRTFGENDKTVLLIGIGVVLAVLAAALGVASERRPWIAFVALAGLGSIGIGAALTRPDAPALASAPTLVGVGAGALTLVTLRLASSPSEALSVPAAEGGFDRRRFLVASAAAAVGALAAGGAGTLLGRRLRADASRAEVVIPDPMSSAAPVGGKLRVPGLEPFFTPNERFYRVDTALLVPAVTAEEWRLRIHGMVGRELTIDYAGLLSRTLIERDVTLACVSNEVGGRYVGNARWIGVPLGELLEEAGVDPRADQLVSRSADGFTAGTPAADVMDGRDAMLTVAMNGEPLPIAHGFPVRMVVPGLYGYVSATKWLVELELTTFDAFDAYWVRRGWAERAPVKTMSRIDTPRGLSPLRAGEVPVAGVAWAQQRGIARVELRVDDGGWLPAELAPAGSIDTWRQWVVRWEATPGEHRLQVRATDGEGETQPDARVGPFPDGATGWHTIIVNVT
jgi:DMSO/TMAO reductase YedYZ molybdopterin-dependent catalytic subunit